MKTHESGALRTPVCRKDWHRVTKFHIISALKNAAIDGCKKSVKLFAKCLAVEESLGNNPASPEEENPNRRLRGSTTSEEEGNLDESHDETDNGDALPEAHAHVGKLEQLKNFARTSRGDDHE